MPGVSYGGTAANTGIVTITSSSAWNAWGDTYLTGSTTGSTVATNFIDSSLNRRHVETAIRQAAHQAELTGDAWTAWNLRLAAQQLLTATGAGGVITLTGTSASTTINTWNAWGTAHSAQGVLPAREGVVRQISEGRQPTAEQRERWRLEEIRHRESEAKRLRESLEAKEKAIVLLKSCLSPEQLEEFEKRKCFHLHVGDKTYRIEHGQHGNVKLVDKNGRIKRVFCVQPAGVPDGDAMLAQKLLLQTDEKRFYELANVTEFADDGRQLRTIQAPRGADLLRDVQAAAC